MMLSRRKLLLLLVVSLVSVASLIAVIFSPETTFFMLRNGLDLTDAVTSGGSPPCQDGRRQRMPKFIDMTDHTVFQWTPRFNMYIHRAFVDDRFNKTTLRIFGVERNRTTAKWWKCAWLAQDENGNDVRRETYARIYYVYPQWPTDSIYQTCNFDCHLDPKHDKGVRIPEYVQLVSEKGHSFRVPIEQTRRMAPKLDLGVCVKPVTGEWDVYRLIEWIEIQRLSGIKHFIVYQTDITGYSRFVLEYYQRLGVITVVSFPYLAAVLSRFKQKYKQMDWKEEYYIHQKAYLVAIHDCLYRFYGSYTFMQFVDLDEFILPTDDEDYPSMINNLFQEHPRAAGFHFLTSWHYEESGKIAGMGIPDYLYTQQYPISTRPKLSQPKSVIVASRVITTSYHMVQDVPNTSYKKVPVPPERGYLHHYRGTCSKKFQKDRCKKELLDTRLDTVVVRYQDDLEERVRHVMDHLQIEYDDWSIPEMRGGYDLVHPNAVII